MEIKSELTTLRLWKATSRTDPQRLAKVRRPENLEHDIITQRPCHYRQQWVRIAGVRVRRLRSFPDSTSYVRLTSTMLASTSHNVKRRASSEGNSSTSLALRCLQIVLGQSDMLGLES